MSPGSVDAIILLGNSPCLVKKINQIERCLEQFYSLLKPGGCILVDERNFTYINELRNEILGGKFRYSGKYMYCGSAVTGRPVEINSPYVTFGYFRKNGEFVGALEMHAFKDGELAEL